MSSMYDASVDVLFVIFAGWLYKTCIGGAGAFINRQQTIYEIFKQTKLSST